MAEIRFYLDEHAASAVAKGLRRRGVDVLTVPEAQTRGHDDKDQLALANRLGRVLFTHDADDLVLAAQGEQHCGIVFAPRGMSFGACIQALTLIQNALTAEDMIGRIEFI